MRLLAYGLLAAVGVGVGVTLTVVQQRYVPGDPMNGARMFWFWVCVVVWVAGCGAAALSSVRTRRRG
jgi:hypothetical protein